MKNRHLSKAIAEQNFYTFRERLTAKCNQLGIEVRIAGRFFPSSKMCHKCGAIKYNLRLNATVDMKMIEILMQVLI